MSKNDLTPRSAWQTGLRRWWPWGVLFLWWALGVYGAIHSYYGSSPPVDLSDPMRRHYGVNYPGDLAHWLPFHFIELVILVAILRPLSYRRSWGRVTAALVVLTPWTGILLLGSMHQGPIYVGHWLWLLGCMIGLLLALGVHAVAHFASKE